MVTCIRDREHLPLRLAFTSLPLKSATVSGAKTMCWDLFRPRLELHTPKQICLRGRNNVASTLPQADWYFSGCAKGLSTEFQILAGADRRHYCGYACHQFSVKFDHLVYARLALVKNYEETELDKRTI
ncbi:hypothetical protein B0H14DRAFT_2564169 [Mycena olivaceomarginata]|nr:hypothetical protein B0H14DRAFT_2564169 [Mycena olivaceomarginata]